MEDYNVGIYIRLSRDDNENKESESITNQRNIIKNFCETKDDLIICDEYIDDGYTGTNFDRPGFQRLLNDVKENRINCIVVKDLSRLGRDRIDSDTYLFRIFPENNVRFISINDNYDSINEFDSELMISLKNSFNAQYSKDISKKVQSAIKSKAKQGLFIGSHACYGYKKDLNNKNRLIIDEYAASIVKKIFNLFICGYGKLSIAKLLNEKNILCPTEYKKSCGSNYANSKKLESTYYWTANSIDAILKQEIYTGTMVQGKRNSSKFFYGGRKIIDKGLWIRVPNTHEPIIDKETFDKVQNLLKLNTRQINLKENLSIFSGLIKCGNCGRALIKSKECTKYKDSKYSYLSYRCRTYKDYGINYCTSHRIKHSILVRTILSDLNSFIDKLNNVDKIIDNAYKGTKKEQEYKIRIENIQKELMNFERKKKRAYYDYNDGLLSKSEYIQFKNDIENKKITLNKELEFLNINAEDKIHILFENPIIKRLYNREFLTESELTRELIVEFVKSITVYENKETKQKNIEIEYTFSNETELVN